MRSLFAVAVLALFAFALINALPFEDPKSYTSSNGVLELWIVDAVSNITIAGELVTARVWNESFIAPTLRLNRGDWLILHLVNELGIITNLHYHGLTIPPVMPADDIFLEIESGTVFTYKFQVPSNHPQGLFYYHSHADMLSEWQVFNGMSGALIIEGLLDPFPQLSNITEHIFSLKDIQLIFSNTSDIATIPEDMQIDSNAPTLRLTNGLESPTLTMPVGDTQLWRFANIGADIFYNISFGVLETYVIAKDGQRTLHLDPVEFYLLGPSSRVECLVVAPSQPVEFDIITQAMTTGPAGDMYPEWVIAQINVTSSSVPAPIVALPQPDEFPPLVDLRNVTLGANRTFVFSENTVTGYLYIDGEDFNNENDTVLVYVPFGDVELWTIVNTALELHHFHIHQGDFQVVSINGEDVEFNGYQDTVVLPYADATYDSNGDVTSLVPSVVNIILPFNKPTQIGKFVFHCHILAHEDLGMMAAIQVVAPVCPAGSYLPSDSASCEPCPPLSYSFQPGATSSCTPCPFGYVSAANSTSCYAGFNLYSIGTPLSSGELVSSTAPPVGKTCVLRLSDSLTLGYEAALSNESTVCCLDRGVIQSSNNTCLVTALVANTSTCTSQIFRSDFVVFTDNNTCATRCYQTFSQTLN